MSLDLQKYDLDEAHSLLEGDYLALYVDCEWSATDEFTSGVARLIDDNNLPTTGVGFSCFPESPGCIWYQTIFIAPSKTALLYVLSIPGVEILDVKPKPGSTAEDWYLHLREKYF